LNQIPTETVFWPARLRTTVADPVSELLALGVPSQYVGQMVGASRLFGTMNLSIGTGPGRAWVFLTPSEGGLWSVHCAADGTEARTSEDAEASAAEGQRLLGGDWAVIRHERADLKAMGWIA